MPQVPRFVHLIFVTKSVIVFYITLHTNLYTILCAPQKTIITRHNITNYYKVILTKKESCGVGGSKIASGFSTRVPLVQFIGSPLNPTGITSGSVVLAPDSLDLQTFNLPAQYSRMFRLPFPSRFSLFLSSGQLFNPLSFLFLVFFLN